MDFLTDWQDDDPSAIHTKTATALYDKINQGSSFIPLLENRGEAYNAGSVSVDTLREFIESHTRPTWTKASKVLSTMRWPILCDESTTPRIFLRKLDEYISRTEMVPVRRIKSYACVAPSSERQRFSSATYCSLDHDIKISYNAVSSITGVAANASEAVDRLPYPDKPFGKMSFFEASDFLSRYIRYLTNVHCYCYDVRVDSAPSLFVNYPSYKIDLDVEIRKASTSALPNIDPSSSGPFICRPEELTRFQMLYPRAIILVLKNTVKDTWLQPFLLPDNYVSKRVHDPRPVPRTVSADYGLWTINYTLHSYSSYIFFIPLSRTGSAFATKAIRSLAGGRELDNDLVFTQLKVEEGTTVLLKTSLPEYRKWKFAIKHNSSKQFDPEITFFPSRHIGELIGSEFIHCEPLEALSRYLRSTKTDVSRVLQIHGFLPSNKKLTRDNMEEVKQKMLNDFLRMLPLSYLNSKNKKAKMLSRSYVVRVYADRKFADLDLTARIDSTMVLSCLLMAMFRISKRTVRSSQESKRSGVILKPSAFYFPLVSFMVGGKLNVINDVSYVFDRLQILMKDTPCYSYQESF